MNTNRSTRTVVLALLALLVGGCASTTRSDPAERVIEGFADSTSIIFTGTVVSVVPEPENFISLLEIVVEDVTWKDQERVFGSLVVPPPPVEHGETVQAWGWLSDQYQAGADYTLISSYLPLRDTEPSYPLPNYRVWLGFDSDGATVANTAPSMTSSIERLLDDGESLEVDGLRAATAFAIERALQSQARRSLFDGQGMGPRESNLLASADAAGDLTGTDTETERLAEWNATAPRDRFAGSSKRDLPRLLESEFVSRTYDAIALVILSDATAINDSVTLSNEVGMSPTAPPSDDLVPSSARLIPFVGIANSHVDVWSSTDQATRGSLVGTVAGSASIDVPSRTGLTFVVIRVNATSTTLEKVTARAFERLVLQHRP